MQQRSVLTDIAAMRIRARARIEEVAVTAGYTADRDPVLQMLNDSLATQLVCVLRYPGHHVMARGIHSQSVAQDFLGHSNEDLVAQRIAIDSYREFIQYLGDKDPTTRRMLEGIMAVEEQHTDELADLLVAVPA